MLVRDLPEAIKQELRALTTVTGEPWDIPEDMTVQELELWLETWRDDYQTKIDRQRRRMSVEQELAEFARPVHERYPDLPIDKVEYFLHGKDRARFQVLLRELKEMCKVPLVTCDRQPWHGAVEQEVCNWLEQGAGGTIDDVVEAVLARD